MDRRELTGARSLQTAWSALALALFVAVGVRRPSLVDPLPLAVGTGGWLLGLALFGWRDRRAWHRQAARSTFEPAPGRGYVDLHREVKGHTVTVSADVPSLLTQTQTVVSTTLATGQDAPAIELERVGEGATGTGIEVGTPALDGAWVIEGPAARVESVLSTDVQAALLDVTVPVAIDVRADGVTARVPFTGLRPAELAALADAVATVAERVARLGPPQGPDTTFN